MHIFEKLWTSPNHITRYYDQSQYDKQGAFIGVVPSLSQYIFGNSTFYTRNDYDMLEVICAIAFCISAAIDGNPLMSLDRNFTTIPIHGTNFYTIRATIPTKGFHTLTSTSDTNGPYSYYVIGRTVNATYGYLGAINSCMAILLSWTHHTCLEPRISGVLGRFALGALPGDLSRQTVESLFQIEEG
ncbi:unnamed protein product [Haemonchus placei]|uniref:Calpain catalytic domain-containing protein n=1 Tax=Haemonchus placei TaxID=6290 RepID=A0A0N4WX95_HAEPC|nr:unnamed protein product [Haemonchus placei]